MKKKPHILAVIPARSGSKGVPNKNIRKIAEKELLAYSIGHAQKLGVEQILCSTDSPQYADIAKLYGAEVPFLRSEHAAQDTAMEEHILEDLYINFDRHGIQYPDLFVWLRPTFVFRDIAAIKECIKRMLEDESLTACRVVVEAESRIYYADNGGFLHAAFNDKGKSMVRRQDVEKKYRVYNTDVFRGNPKNHNPAFLGDRVGYVVADKICGLDIDDERDLLIVSKVMESLSHDDMQRYL